MESVIVRRTGERPLKFQGELLIGDGTSLNNASASYSGSTGHAQDVKVYRTAKGKYVVAIHHQTLWQGAHDSDEAEVLQDRIAVVDYLKERLPRWLIQDIIKELGEEELAIEVE